MKLGDIPMVKEYMDMFLDDLPIFPPNKDVEFTIDILPGTTSIFMAPYMMAPLELQKSKVQV